MTRNVLNLIIGKRARDEEKFDEQDIIIEGGKTSVRSSLLLKV